MRGVLGLIVWVAGIATALTKAYSVVPYRGCIGILTSGRDGVSQYVRNTLDSITQVSFWVGDTIDTSKFNILVEDSATGHRIAHREGWHATRCWYWMNVPLLPDPLHKPVRNRTCKISVSRPTTRAPISFAYDPRNPYGYGKAVATGSSMPDTADLALRVCGLHDAVDSTIWGATCFLPDSHRYWNKWSDSMRVSGAKWGTFYVRWDTIQMDSTQFNFSKFDSSITNMVDDAGIEPVPVLIGTPKWASSRIQTYIIDSNAVVDTSVFAPPMHMDTGPNFWVRYLDTLLTHGESANRPADKVHAWSIWNEPNEGCDSFYDGPQNWHGYTGWWRSPSRYYDSLDTSWTYRCSLYVQLCSLAANTIRAHDGHENDRIVVGELGGVENYNDAWKTVRGRDWLHRMYAIASSHFWDVISAHPYQTPQVGVFFDPDAFAVYAETLRTIMRGNGDWSELWDTEADYGMVDAVTEEQNANGNCEAMISTMAQAGLPGGTYDRICWWMSCGKQYYGSWCLFDDTIYPRAGRFAFSQVTSTLTGKRFKRRVMADDTMVDNHMRMYEFEDPATLRRTWVCWADGDVKHSIKVKLPVRTDQLAAESLAYSSTTPAFTPRVADDGWLRMSLDVRPVFIHEVSSPERPDMRVDSVRFVSENRSVRAWVTNHGTRATPVRSGLRRPYPTWAVLGAEGDSLAQAVRRNPIEVGEQAEFSFDLNSTTLPDTALLSVTVNPNQLYVELDMDDNAGYTLAIQP